VVRRKKDFIFQILLGKADSTHQQNLIIQSIAGRSVSAASARCLRQ